MANDNNNNEIWVFGYGSLCWYPGFQYSHAITGFIRGFSRRFWQGNTTHRGTPRKPGRVATLVEDEDGVVWGRAFLVSDPSAIPYLDKRECQLGGYITTTAQFTPKCDGCPPFSTYIYVATSDNCLWLGESSEFEIALEIVSSSGPSGHNVEYLLRLAEFMREHIPGAKDDHLFYLEELVLSLIRERNLCLKTLMGQKPHLPPEPSGRELFKSSFVPKHLPCLSI